MWKFNLALSSFLWLFSNQSFSTEQSKTSQNIHVIQLDPNIDVKELESDGVKTYTNDKVKTNATQKTYIEKRENIFATAGVDTHITTMDSVDKDMLYSRSRYMSLEDLSKTYPKIPNENLVKLIKLKKQEEKKQTKRTPHG